MNTERQLTDSTAAPPEKVSRVKKGASRERKPQGWSGRNVGLQREQKRAMAEYFVNHDFLVNESPSDSRLKAATIIVNPGTTQQSIVSEALDWMIANNQEADITWYTPGTIIPTVLKEKRDAHPDLLPATQLFMFPGRLDIQIDSLSSPETADYVKSYDRTFTYALLSAKSLNIRTGKVYFHFSSEIQLQHAIAVKEAQHKFLFLDPTKLDSISEGGIGYTVEDLLKTSRSVTLYTVSTSPAKDRWICESFEQLVGQLIKQQPPSKEFQPEVKHLRLRIVGTGKNRTEAPNFEGPLLASHKATSSQGIALTSVTVPKTRVA